MTSKNLMNRNGTWYVRRQVPVDLLVHYPSTDIRMSLRTKDKREAERLMHAALVKLDEQFEAKRRELRREDEDRRYYGSEQFWELREKLGGHVNAMAEPAFDYSSPPKDRGEVLAFADEGLRQNAYDKQYGLNLITATDEDGEPIQFAVPVRFLDKVTAFVGELLEAEERSLRAINDQVQQKAGKSSSTTEAGSNRLGTLVNAWVKVRKPADKTLLEMSKAIERFEAANGPLAYTDITVQHARQFKDALLGLGRKAATVKKQWSMIHSLLEVAKDNALLPTNPLSSIAFRVENDAEEREDFTKEDLKSLFQTIPHGSRDWWELRICLYSGARQGEVHQLNRTDVHKVDGVWCFDFNMRDGKSLKTRNSIRLVPIHQQLIADGLLMWLPEEGQLFEGTASAASKRLNRAISDAGITCAGKVVHSARHTFKSAAHEAGMGEDLEERLMGHKSQRTSRMYGTHSLAKLKTAVDRVSFGIET